MGHIFIKIQESLPEINYIEPEIPKNRCAVCKHSYCPNKGANITVLTCKVVKKMIKKYKLEEYEEDGNIIWYSCLVNNLGICDNFK